MAITFVNNGSLSSGAVNFNPGIPAGVQSGDILLCEIGGFSITAATAAGWTALASQVAFNHQTFAFWKIAGSSESAPTFTNTGGGSGCAMIYAFRGVKAVSPFDVTFSWFAPGSNATVPAVTTVAANAWIVYFGFVGAQGGTSITSAPNGGTFLGQNTDSGGNVLTGAAYLQTTTPGTVPSASFGGVGSANLTWGGALSLKPSAKYPAAAGAVTPGLLIRRRRASVS